MLYVSIICWLGILLILPIATMVLSNVWFITGFREKSIYSAIISILFVQIMGSTLLAWVQKCDVFLIIISALFFIASTLFSLGYILDIEPVEPMITSDDSDNIEYVTVQIRS